MDNYGYHPGEMLAQRRTVPRFNTLIDRAEMSEPLKSSIDSIGTVSNVAEYAAEIDSFLSGKISQRRNHCFRNGLRINALGVISNIEFFRMINFNLFKM